MRARTVVASVAAATLSTLGLTAVTAMPTFAAQSSVPAPATGAMPSVIPSTKSPAVTDGDVRAIARVGKTMVIGGNFTNVAGSVRNHLAAFDPATGALTSFATSVNGEVDAIVPGPDDHSVYIGGAFTQVGTAAAQFVALVDLNTGALVPGFKAAAFDFGKVNDLVKRGNRLYVAGFFSKVGGKSHAGLAALNAGTGAVDPFMNVQLSGHHNDTGSGAQGYVGPWAFDVTPDGSQMVATGNFKNANGLLRDQLVTIDLTGSTAAVRADWATSRYSPYCFNWAFDGYTRGVSYSPDGSYFVVNATGGGVAETLCDATARFETAGSGADVQPTWVNEAGGDTMWGTTITDTAVFVGGHARWNNNPTGSDYAGPGAVPRPGLAALDPKSGRPLQWNPGRNPPGKAVYAMLATSDGLYVGSDTDWIGNRKYKRPKLAFFPYAGGSTVADDKTGQLPGSVFLAGAKATGTSNVMFRVNAGGGSIQSLDSGPDWADDSGGDSTYRNSGTNAAGWDPVPSVDATVPSSTPSAIFNSERWSPSDSPAMDWAFPVAQGTPLQVRLYFANRCSCTNTVGARVFDVSIDGAKVLSSYDIVASVGDQTGTMKSFDISSDGIVNIDFAHLQENPLINGIEIVRTDIPAAPPADADGLSTVALTGAGASPAQVASNGGVAWGQSRGAFMVGNKVYYGLTDGYLYSRTFDGSTFGPATQVNPYHDPTWKDVDNHLGGTFDGAVPTLYSQIPNLTGMFYANSRLYYTLFGDSTLHSRWFSPDSGVVDERVLDAPSTVDFNGAGGMFAAGGNLYYVTKSTGELHRVAFSDGAVTGSPTLVSGPSVDGVNWENRAMFLYNGPALNQAPTAAFASQCSDLACTFSGEGSSDPDGTVASYAWTFGDGSTGTGVSGSHTYTAAGSFTVTLVVTDNKGATGTVGHQVTVTDPPPNQAPAAAFTSQCTDLACTFSGEGSSDPDGTVASYAWTFGDGSTGTGVSASHTYTAAGSFTVTLVVTDNKGATGTVGHQVTVTDPPPNQAPAAAFTSQCTDLACTFSGEGSSDPDGTVASYAWTFGDGSTGTGVSASHTYTAAGNFTVTLVVTDNKGATGSVTHLVSVTAPLSPLAFVGASHSAPGSTKTKQALVPAGTSVGDTMLLFFTKGNTSTWTGPTGVGGWTQVDSFTNSTVTSTVWQKVATASDLGATVRMDNTAYQKAVLTLAVYSGADEAGLVAAHSADSATASHKTPTVTAAAGDWVVSYWGDKSSGTDTWTAPSDVKARDTAIDNGASGRYGSLLADSDGPVAAGTYGGLTATTNAASEKATMWTVKLRPKS